MQLNSKSCLIILVGFYPGCYKYKMKSENIYETERLILRSWRKEDIEPFARMNADPDVMRFFESKLTLEQTQKSLEKIENCQKKYGYTFWALEHKANSEFMGCVGIFMSDDYKSPFGGF